MRTRNLLLVTAFCGAIGSSAQLSLGVDVAIPSGDFGDFYSLGVGPGLGYDLGLGDALIVFGQASYDFLITQSDYSDIITSAYMIPYQAGIKFYFSGETDGVYAMALLGGHTIGTKTEFLGVEDSNSSSLFSWGLGGGFRSGKLDFAARYNSISPDNEIDDANASNYIGVRIGYFLGGD